MYIARVFMDLQYLYASVHICTIPYIYVYIYMYVYICIYLYTYIYTYLCIIRVAPCGTLCQEPPGEPAVFAGGPAAICGLALGAWRHGSL